jgi:hypothetical protein
VALALCRRSRQLRNLLQSEAINSSWANSIHNAFSNVRLKSIDRGFPNARLKSIDRGFPNARLKSIDSAFRDALRQGSESNRKPE